MNKKIKITGGSGRFGQEIVQSLQITKFFTHQVMDFKYYKMSLV